MIEILLLGLIYASNVLIESVYFFNLWFSRRFFLSIPCLICLGIFILVVIIIALLLREFIRESTKRCPYCGKRIPTDAAWCKFCKRDLTEDFGQLNNFLDFKRSEEPCPDCDHDMQFISENRRWFCPYCKEYK